MSNKISKKRQVLGYWVLGILIAGIALVAAFNKVTGYTRSYHVDRAFAVHDKNQNFEGSLEISMGDRRFNLPFKYYGHNPQGYIAGYPDYNLFVDGLVARYPDFKAGYPYYDEKHKGIDDKGSVYVTFYLLSDDGMATRDRANYSSPKDFERVVKFRTQKSEKNNEEKTTILGFDAYKKNNSFWSYAKDQNGSAIQTLGCGGRYGSPEIRCHLAFMDRGSGLGFTVGFNKVHLNDWESIRDKSVSLVKSFEVN